MKNNYVYKMAVSGLLIAVGIIIPMFSPLKIVMEPASFTLGSHIAIFIAMLVSPSVAAAVAIGTTAGFFFGGFPLVVVLRAASHIVFALAGALFIRRYPHAVQSAAGIVLYSLAVAVIHAVLELAVVTAFYSIGGMGEAYYAYGFFRSVLLMVGAGTVIHSMVDFAMAYGIAHVLRKTTPLFKLPEHKGSL